MAAIGVGLLWWSYWWGLGGVSLVKGWNNNVLQLANPVHPPTFTKACYVGSGIWPTGKSGDSGSCKSGSGGGSVAALQRRAAATARNQGRPLPGSVQSRL